MKKSILLFALPALLVLSGCAKVNVNNPEREDDFIFAEDTEAHSELFGGEEEWFGLKKQPLFAMTPGEGALTKPTVGKQYMAAYEEDKDKNGTPEQYTAVRFLAGVADLNVKAVWTRAAYRVDNGNIVGSRAPVESKKAYTVINNGGSLLNATSWEDESGNHPFSYFVVYTIYDIPLESIDDYYFAAYLTLSNPEDDSEYIDSSEVVTYSDPTDLDDDTTWSFPANKTGYFALVFGNTENQFISEDSPTRNSNRASFTLDLDEDQEFIIVQNDVNSKFFIYYGDVLDYADNSAVLESFENAGFIRAKEAAKFALYLNNEGHLYKHKYTKSSSLYVVGPAASNEEDNWNFLPAYQCDGCPSEDNNRCYILNVQLYVGDFCIANTGWTDQWGYWGYKTGGGGVDWLGERSPRIINGSAKDNFEAGSATGDGSGNKNIHCKVAGRYDLYLTDDNYIYVSLAA